MITSFLKKQTNKKNTSTWSRQRYHGSFYIKTRYIIDTYMTYQYTKNQDRIALINLHSFDECTTIEFSCVFSVLVTFEEFQAFRVCFTSSFDAKMHMYALVSFSV